MKQTTIGREHYEALLNDYFTSHEADVMKYVLEKMGYPSLAAMRREEMTGMWFDCGWVKLTPRDEKCARAWKRKHGTDNLYYYPPIYPTQSTTIMKHMVDKALKDLNLTDELWAHVTLD